MITPAPVVVEPAAPVYSGSVPAAPAYPASAPVANQVVCVGSNSGAILGGAAGGVTGAALGASASPQHSWEAATGGAILGMLLGGAVGHAADIGDQYCTTQAIVAGPVGQPVFWANPAYGMRYQVMPTRQYLRGSTTCRDYQASALIDGRVQQVRGTACRQVDGSWQLISS